MIKYWIIVDHDTQPLTILDLHEKIVIYFFLAVLNKFEHFICNSWLNSLVFGCHIIVPFSNYLWLPLFFLFKSQKSDQSKDDENDEDGNAETHEPGRTGGLDSHCTLLLGQPRLHLVPPHTVPAEKVYYKLYARKTKKVNFN